jgi:RNA recognition motif-containing protein
MARLFVGNLPYTANETDLQNFFAEAGCTVDNIDVMRDRFSGEARGFAFIEINDENMAQLAVQNCNGKELMGRALVVNEARPMNREGGAGAGASRGPRSASSAGPGGGGGGGPRQRDFGGSKNRW